MRFALESARVGTWEIDFTSGWALWSDVQEQLHGISAGGFGGMLSAFAECIHPEDRQRVLDGISHSFREESDSRLEYRTTWPDGSIHWIAASGRTFYSDTGAPIRAAGVGVDITAQKNLEEQFRQAQKLEAIGGLAAGIAHDFNNLLTVMTGYCALLAPRFADDPEVAQELGEIRRATESASALTRQLLAFSRRQILAPHVVNINTILTDSQAMLRRLVEENVRIDLHLADTVSFVNVDAGQIEQVLLNLVINARDAMPNGGVVTTTTKNVVLTESLAGSHMNVPGGSYVLFSVSDTGSGMSPEILARIFEPFFTTKERGRGTGLGLATVYGIVKQSEGYITVASEVDKGTTFAIYLPVAVAAAAPPVVEPKPVVRELDGTETILVVEDDSALRTLSLRILERRGYTVLAAGDGERAQQICAEYQGSIHAVLMDVVMPGRNGREIADWIRQRRPEIKVVYTSGYTDGVLGEQGVLEADTLFLHKPFTPDALAGKIREALS
jgi:PAS domain S-box-containing protein